jgi:hypothetical protein
MLQRTNRTVIFPAEVNQRQGAVEYAIVTATGKTHESVFRTLVEPQQIHLAMLLLGVKPAGTNMFPEDLSVPPPGQHVWIEYRWQDGPHHCSRPLETSIIVTNNSSTLPAGPWTYNGSHVASGTFAAQREGSIVSIQIDPAALINNPRPNRENDDLHHVNPAALPPPNTPVLIAISLAPPPNLSPRNPATSLNPDPQPIGLPAR